MIGSKTESSEVRAAQHPLAQLRTAPALDSGTNDSTHGNTGSAKEMEAQVILNYPLLGVPLRVKYLLLVIRWNVT